MLVVLDCLFVLFVNAQADGGSTQEGLSLFVLF